MSSKTTWRLFFAAIALFAFIVFVERRQGAGKPTGETAQIFPKLAAATVNGIEIQSTNVTLRAEKTNDAWRLTRPFYPAQSTPIDAFVKALSALPKYDVISAQQVAEQQGKLKDFGLDPPIAALTLTQGSNRYLLNLGSLTPLRDQLYATAPGSGEVLVTDASILKAFPASVNDWRSQMVLHLAGRPFDHIQIRAGQSILEFENDPTNLIWRISKPTPARANNQRIIELLQQLNTARVKSFVTDSPTADLEKFGLQTPELELSFLLDTNAVTGLQFGASPTNDPTSIYVRRLSTTNIVLASRDLFDALSLPYKAFHDPRLISMDLREPTMIQVKGATPFTLARQTNGAWVIAEPNPMPADPDLVGKFLTNFFRLPIENFAKDVPTDADLKEFGLAPPWISFGLYSTRTNATGGTTNALIVEFGKATPEALMYARRSDETPVYLTYDAKYLLPTAAWRLRERQIYNFASSNVAAIAFSAHGQTNRFPRGPQGWIVGDSIRNAALEEVVFRLGNLHAVDWVGKGTAQLATLGIQPDSLTLQVELPAGNVPAPPIVFGKLGARDNVYAATYLPGDAEPSLFIFPGDLYKTLLNGFAGR